MTTVIAITLGIYRPRVFSPKDLTTGTRRPWTRGILEWSMWAPDRTSESTQRLSSSLHPVLDEARVACTL